MNDDAPGLRAADQQAHRSRLPSTARPGTILLDRALADQLEGDADLRLRRLRRTSVTGYRTLEPGALRRAAPRGQ